MVTAATTTGNLIPRKEEVVTDDAGGATEISISDSGAKTK
jgi:hypothetical protein